VALRIWTKDEEHTLVSLLGKMSISAIAVKMKRSYDSVKHKAKAHNYEVESNKWSDEEVSTLKEMVGKFTSTKIGVKIGRTKDAVLKKMEHLGIQGKKKGFQGSWTDEQIEKLKLLCATMTAHQFATENRFTDDQVYGKAKALGIRMRPALLWTPESIEVLRSSKNAGEAAKSIGKTLRAVRKKAREIGYVFPETTVVTRSSDTPKRDRKKVINLAPERKRYATQETCRVEWCKTCGSPVVDWAGHTARIGCKRVA
jgi:hypothetical protein